jgi:hypothetical protein
MLEAAKKQNIFSQWLSWQFFEAPKGIISAWKNFLKFNLNYFSVGLLFKTLFSPWRRIQASYGKGFDFGRYLSAFASNMIFRLLGALVRSFLIVAALFIEALILIVGAVAVLGWFILPLLFIAGFIFGVYVIF